MTDAQRLDFLANLMDMSVRLELSPDGLPQGDADRLKARSLAVFKGYELHRRTTDTPTAFRLAVDAASNPPQKGVCHYCLGDGFHEFGKHREPCAECEGTGAMADEPSGEHR